MKQRQTLRSWAHPIPRAGFVHRLNESTFVGVGHWYNNPHEKKKLDAQVSLLLDLAAAAKLMQPPWWYTVRRLSKFIGNLAVDHPVQIHHFPGGVELASIWSNTFSNMLFDIPPKVLETSFETVTIISRQSPDWSWEVTLHIPGLGDKKMGCSDR